MNPIPYSSSPSPPRARTPPSPLPPFLVQILYCRWRPRSLERTTFAGFLPPTVYVWLKTYVLWLKIFNTFKVFFFFIKHGCRHFFLYLFSVYTFSLPSFVNFAQWRYSNQWSSREVLLLLVENYNQYPAQAERNISDWGNFWRLLREQ